MDIRMKRIKRLLIANRGEIVCRIIASCRRMGIETVSVFAADDRGLPHACAADFNCLLEGEALSETYLNIDQIIAVARRTRADAIHPGYGFLSENAAFAAAVAKAGLVFVGPPADVIARMGDKAASRQLCDAIGVPTVPGYDGKAQDETTLTREAKAIGFPVLVKASAGGGGKGMRVVEHLKDLPAALESARSEAQNAFGNGRLLLERYLQRPRHIEVQVFSDQHGHHLHMFERECSIQRRHQKIVEESPAPGLPDATRHKLYESAVRIAKHIGYVGAGTVEFMLDEQGRFYFLEMNTRLQVEHPVTEAVTGLDLVALQLQVAMGDVLPFTQSDIKSQGHAVEVRLYAEDAERGFLPAAGTLTALGLPQLPGTRCESGYVAGNTVSSRYDPMIAKLSAHGRTRQEAVRALLAVLEETALAGITTNRAFLSRVLSSEPFMGGDVSTDFLTRNAALLSPPDVDDALKAAAIAALLLFGQNASADHAGTTREEHSAWVHSNLAGWRCT